MPLLKKKVFEKQSLPDFLRDDEEVFYCEITNEIFRDYEEFSERMFLYNSMVWTCAMTGKANLTYQEALECEENAKQSLKEFPIELRIPILYLASKTQRTSFGEMAEDVFMYVKDRYFTGENLETSFTGSKWKDSHVLQVIAPSAEKLKGIPKNGTGNPTERHFWPPANQFKYEIEHLDAYDTDISEIMIVDCNQIRRPKGVFNREKCKLFLKQYTEQDAKGVFTIKQSVLDIFGISKMKFDQIFDGPPPQFETSKKLEKPNPKKKMQKQETLAKFLTKNNGSNLPKPPQPAKEDKNVNKVNLLEEMKKREEEFQLRKALKEEERLILKRKQKEEYLKITAFIRDWSKPKDDLLLEDQKKLPIPTPVKTKVPEEHFGEMLMIMEFIENFSKFLSTKNFFPGGVTLELMERALLGNEIAGPFTDMIQMLLTAIFNAQDEESSQYTIAPDYSRIRIKDEEAPKVFSLRDATRLATVALKWSFKHQGLSLGRLPLYSVTVSEILRLHLLSSGARINETGTRWRYAQRGGYTPEDDPGLHLRLNHSHILRFLAVYNVIQLPIEDRLQIISCLINQLLTYAEVRDVLEERLDRIKQLKTDVKTLQLAEKKREQEQVTNRMKLKTDLKADKPKLKEALEKLEKDNEKKQIDNNRKISKVLQSLYDLQCYMGADRANRKYYRCDSIPAILVSNEERLLDDCLPKVTEQNPDLVNANRQQLLRFVRKTLFNHVKTNKKNPTPTKVNGVLNPVPNENCGELLMCSADPATCTVHSLPEGTPTWWFFKDKFDLDDLENGLNKRGLREGELLEVVKNDKDRLLNIVSQTPLSLLNPEAEATAAKEEEDSQKTSLRHKEKKGKYKYDDAYLGYSPQLKPQTILETALLDNILDMEEKIHSGNLGSLQVKDRKEWRELLTNKNYDLLEVIIRKCNKKRKKEKEKQNGPEVVEKKYYDPGRILGDGFVMNGIEEENLLAKREKLRKAVTCLAGTLALVARAVEPKYLKKPLGNADGSKPDRKVDFDHLDRWEQSLLASTSFSQVFLHYGTLDSCVKWSRSVLLARCRICSRKKDSENMLLCDNCNLGHHLYCLKPKLTAIPRGDWFCDRCQKEKEKQYKLLNPDPVPSKKRRIFQDENAEEEEMEDSEEETSTDEDSDSNEDGEIKVELCKQCGSGGELITCETCSTSYHIECCEPPLRRAPRGTWHCHQCTNRKERSKDLSSDSESEMFLAKRRNHRREDIREDLPLHNAALQELLSDVMKQEDAWPFLRPVQTKEVPDYYEIITNPMDFGTIKYKLNMGEYKTDGQLMKDVVLIFENCNTYNDSDADVYKCGVKVLKFFEKRAKELGLKLPEEMNSDDPPKSKKRRNNL